MKKFDILLAAQCAALALVAGLPLVDPTNRGPLELALRTGGSLVFCTGAALQIRKIRKDERS